MQFCVCMPQTHQLSTPTIYWQKPLTVHMGTTLITPFFPSLGLCIKSGIWITKHFLCLKPFFLRKGLISSAPGLTQSHYKAEGNSASEIPASTPQIFDCRHVLPQLACAHGTSCMLGKYSFSTQQIICSLNKRGK